MLCVGTCGGTLHEECSDACGGILTGEFVVSVSFLLTLMPSTVGTAKPAHRSADGSLAV